MRKYLTILFSFALITMMLLPSVITMVSDGFIVNCDFSEDEEKEEHKENQLEKEKIVFKADFHPIMNYLSFKNSKRFEVIETYNAAAPDIQLPPPEVTG